MDWTLFFLAMVLVILAAVLIYVAIRVLAWLFVVIVVPRYVEGTVVMHISTVVRQNLPLATGLALAGESERGQPATHLRWISQLLASGRSLADALNLGYPRCSALTKSLVRAGEKSGQLAAALEYAERYLLESWRRRLRPGCFAIPYACVMLSVAGTVLMGIMVAIIPKYKEIFCDFNARLPTITLQLIDICTWMVTGTPPGCVIMAAIVIPIVYVWLRPRRAYRLALSNRIKDWFHWHVPGLRRWVFIRDTNVAFEVMRMAVRAGLNMPAAARLAGEVDMNTGMRTRINHFADLLEKGTPLRVATRKAGLGAVAGLVLAAGERTNDMESSLRYAADYHWALVARFWSVVRNLAVPATTFLVAFVVGFIILGLFLPLINLINSTAQAP